jgi:glycosyltransferase involved in cell wall biosynthesis
VAARPLILISGKDPSSLYGGHETYVRAHALAALRLGFEPHVICASDRTDRVETEYGLLHRFALGRYEPPAAFEVALLAHGARQVVTRHRAGPEPALMHGFALWSASGVAAARSLARRGIGAVAIASAYATREYEVGVMQSGLAAHHGIVQRARHRAWLRWIRLVDDPIEGWGYAGARAVIVNYESVRQILLSAYGPSLRIRRLPYASSDAFAQDGGRSGDVPPALAVLEPRDAPLVLAISRHDARKGLDLLLLALAGLRTAGVPFRACLVGSGRLLEAHRRLAGGLGLDGCVAIPGEVEDVAPYLEHADVFVQASLGEASGSVSVLEALRAGIPVVASACDGIPEDLSDGDDALLVQPGEVLALRGALERLLRDPALRRRLADGGRATHDRRFSAERFTLALGELYGELASTLPATASAT